MKIQMIVCTMVTVLSLVLPAPLRAQSADVQSKSYVHPASGYRFPDVLESELLDLFRSDVTEHTDERLGVAVAYDSGFKCFANFYLYNLGLMDIPEGPASRAVKMQFAVASGNVFRTASEDQWGNFRRTSSPNSMMQLLAGTPVFLYDTFEFVFEGRPFVSWLLLTGSRQHFLEIRYTCNAFSDWSNKTFAKLLLERAVSNFLVGNRDWSDAGGGAQQAFCSRGEMRAC